MKIIAGIDIGGTKCAVTFAAVDENQNFTFLDKVKEKTITDEPDQAVQRFIEIIGEALENHRDWELSAIGISCGGPLDSRRGLILAPPNLPKWNQVDVYTPLQNAFGVPVAMENDANACALAEWYQGAGKGTQNMVFLTFGTGMGAGLILNGKLYSGTNDMAGEVGHIRMAADGPAGYGKHGSFEGFCSGGGIAKQGQMVAKEAFARHEKVGFCDGAEDLENITAERIAVALEQGDPYAKMIFEQVARKLGYGLSILIDILNPQVIVIGSIYARQEHVLRDQMMEVLRKEALPQSLHVCKICPPALGEKIGDYAAITVGVMCTRSVTGGLYETAAKFLPGCRSRAVTWV